MDTRNYPYRRYRTVNASTIASSRLSTRGSFESAAYFAPRFNHFAERPSTPSTSSAPSDYDYESTSSSSSRSSHRTHFTSPSTSTHSSNPRFHRSTTAPPPSRPLRVTPEYHRSSSAPASTPKPSRRTKRKPSTPTIALASEANLQDRRDEIDIQNMLFADEAGKHVDMALAFITSFTFIFKYFSVAGYLARAQEDFCHAWKSWRAGYRIRKQPFSQTRSKPATPIYTTIIQLARSALPRSIPSIPRIPTPTSLFQFSTQQNNHHHDTPAHIHQSPITIPTPPTSTLKGKGHRIALEPSPPPPPVHRNALSAPPLKPWQRNAAPTNTVPVSTASRLPKIDLQVKVARGMMKAFQKFREFFEYEVAAAEEIFDNPLGEGGGGCEVMRRDGRPVAVLEMDEAQPTIVTHRLYWQGGEEQVPQALSVAMTSLLSHMTITNCSLALEDITAILSMCPSLQTFEVNRIAANAKALGPSLFPAALQPYNPTASLQGHNLASLTITSEVPVNPLFHQILFRGLRSLSLRLHGDANLTNFDFMSSSSTFPSALEIQTFRLRGNLLAVKDAQLRRILSEGGVAFDIASIPEPHQPVVSR